MRRAPLPPQLLGPLRRLCASRGGGEQPQAEQGAAGQEPPPSPGLPVFRLSPDPVVRSPGGLLRNLGNRLKLGVLRSASRDDQLTPRVFTNACRDLLPVIVSGLAEDAADTEGDGSALSGLLQPDCLTTARDHYRRMSAEQRQILASMAGGIVVASVQELSGVAETPAGGLPSPGSGMVLSVQARLILLGCLKPPQAEQVMLFVLQLMHPRPTNPDILSDGFAWSLVLHRNFILPAGAPDPLTLPDGRQFADDGWIVGRVNAMFLRDCGLRAA